MAMTAQQFAALIDEYSAVLVLSARSWCATPEDAVQDAFCRLAAQRTPPDDPAAWLFTAVKNAAVDRGRSESRRKRREQIAARPQAWFYEPAVDNLDAEAAVAALESLPVELREAIIARLWGGLTFEQIAAAYGCSLTTAHRRYEAGIAALREALGEPCPTT